jgi:hypothetical protein
VTERLPAISKVATGDRVVRSGIRKESSMLDRRSIRVAALMLATAAIAAPVASAKPIDSDDSPAMKALRARAIEMERYYSGRDLQTVPNDDRRYFRGADTTEQPAATLPSYPSKRFRGADTTEQPTGRYFRGADTTRQPNGAPSPDIQIVKREVVASDGWDWDDAAIGAGATAVLLIALGAGGALVVRHRTHPQMQ